MLARNIHDEDTIEMQLSAADLEALTRAAETAEESQAAEAAERERRADAARLAAALVSPITIVAPPPSGATALAAPPAASAERMATAFAGSEAAPAAPAPIQSTRALPVWPAPASRPIQVEVVRAPTIAPPAAKLVAPKPITVTVETPSPRRGVSTPALGMAAAAVVALAALIAILYWPSRHTSAPSTIPTPAGPATITAPVSEPTPARTPEAGATELASSEATTVRFANPFDPSEVFEFPPGTPYVEARDQVAQLLLARAKERHAPSPPPRKTTATHRRDPSNNEASLARRL